MIEPLEILYTPLIDPRAMRVAATVRAQHGAELARLATDAATGHPGQFLRWPREESGDTYRSLYYQPTEGVRFLHLRAYIGRPHTYVLGAYVKLTVSVTDGVTTVAAGGVGDTCIPRGWRGDTPHAPAAIAPARLEATSIVDGYLDRDALVTAGLSATDPWRIILESTRGGTTAAWLERVTLEELPRFVVDDAEVAGARVAPFTPRAIVVDDTLTRIQGTVDAAVESSLRTYHCCTRNEGSAAACLHFAADTSYAAILGYEESSGVPLTFWARGRKAVRTDRARFRWCVRYKTSDEAADADIRVTTSVGSYEIALPDTSDVWTDSTVGEGYLAVGEDTLFFEGKLDDAALNAYVSTITVWEYPETS